MEYVLLPASVRAACLVGAWSQAGASQQHLQQHDAVGSALTFVSTVSNACRQREVLPDKRLRVWHPG
jgi:hypothetical protein